MCNGILHHEDFYLFVCVNIPVHWLYIFPETCNLVTVHRTSITVLVLREGIPWPLVWHTNKEDERSSRETKLLQTQGFDPQVCHSKKWFDFSGANLYWPKNYKIHKRLTYKLQVRFVVYKKKSNTAKQVGILMAAGLISPHSHIYQGRKCLRLLSEHEIREERWVGYISY